MGIVDIEWLVRDEQERDVVVLSRPVLHQFPLRKPDEHTRPEGPFAGFENPVEDIHSVRAVVLVPGVGEACLVNPALVRDGSGSCPDPLGTS